MLVVIDLGIVRLCVVFLAYEIWQEGTLLNRRHCACRALVQSRALATPSITCER